MNTTQKIMIAIFLAALAISYWFWGFDNIPVYLVLLGGFVFNFLAAGNIDKLRQRRIGNRGGSLLALIILMMAIVYGYYFLLPLIVVYLIDFGDSKKPTDNSPSA